MSKVLSLFHIVFATRGRCPALKDDKRVELHRIITAIVTEKRSKMLCINSVSDHLHMLINLSTETSLSEFMAAVKAKSSKWLKENGQSTLFDGWCTGYYACTVSSSMVRKTITYIESQAEHHRITLFNNEIKMMCQSMGLSFHSEDLR